MTLPPEGTLVKTLVITDLVASTRMTEELGDAKSSEIFGKQDRLARDLLVRHNGIEVDKTDGFLLRWSRSAKRGRWSNIVNRVVRSTNVPIAELPSPMIRSPSQCPGTARSSTSAGRALIRMSGPTNALPRPRRRARGTRSARPVRRHAVSSRRSAPRPWMYNAW